MKRLLPALVLALLSLLGGNANAATCRLTNKVCTEAGGTKVVNGISLYQDCWHYALTYTCKTGTYQNTCSGLESATGCSQTSTTCTKTSVFGDCEIETRTYKCGTQQSGSITELPATYTITSDVLDYSQCSAITSANATCKESSNVCTAGSGYKTINGLSVYEDCWTWTKTYTCMASNYTDYCAPLESVCQVKEQSCTAYGEDGICNDQKFIYDCDETYTATGLKLIDSQFTITSDTTNTASCDSYASSCYLQSTTCTDPGGTRVVNGLSVTKDCWGYTRNYVCGSSTTTSTCSSINTTGCSLSKTTCIVTAPDGHCSAYSYDYSCTKQGQSSTVTNCSNQIYCLDGNCFDTGYQPNTEFGQSVSQLNGALSAGKDASTSSDPSKIDIFTGNKETCSYYPLSSLNCCDDGGWANGSMGGCDNNDKKLIEDRKNKLTHYVGTYCSEKIPLIGTCIKHSQSYCVYGSMLARIIQEGARSQLGMDWGSAENPSCSGLTPAQIQNVDFSKINFQEYIDTMKADIPTDSELQQQIQSRISQMTK